MLSGSSAGMPFRQEDWLLGIISEFRFLIPSSYHRDGLGAGSSGGNCLECFFLREFSVEDFRKGTGESGKRKQKEKKIFFDSIRSVRLRCQLLPKKLVID